MNTLPDHLRPGLRVVFIGYNAGLESARLGHYYAHRGNAFWRQLAESGLVDPRTFPSLDFSNDGALLAEGIGFTDLCKRPTARASELSRDELILGAADLHRKLKDCQPRVAAFCGRGIFDVFARIELGLSRGRLHGRHWGVQPETVGVTSLWVIPNSSGLASKWRSERLRQLRNLGATLG